ncbi:MAG: hypothetical protein E7493_04955 [Ruminococcus albus]|nr:hypothetical protein [Ruminococcus albus]
MIKLFFNVVIPLTHHKNGGFTELKVVGVYLFVYSIFSRCAKGIVIFFNVDMITTDFIRYHLHFFDSAVISNTYQIIYCQPHF